MESSTADGWVLRSTGGVTQRANSIWPVYGAGGVAAGGAVGGDRTAGNNAAGDDAAGDNAAKLRVAANWYTARRQPVIFQLTRRSESAALEEFLDARGYSRQSETIIMTAPAHVEEFAPSTSASSAALPSVDFTVSCADFPDKEWLGTWWSVDGRGGPAEKQLGQGILTSVPSLYAAARNCAGEVVGTGRLTIVDGWGGVYAMATHPDFRRQGVAAEILQELKRSAAAAGADRLWLMVTAANTGAQALYAAAGFVEQARYHYRQAPLRRAVGAC